MDLQKLSKVSNDQIAEWVRKNSKGFSLVADSELEDILLKRDYWEQKATELANDIGNLLGVNVGEHSNINCPVQNAIDAVYQATNKQAKATALKQKLRVLLDDEKLN